MFFSARASRCAQHCENHLYISYIRKSAHTSLLLPSPLPSDYHSPRTSTLHPPASAPASQQAAGRAGTSPLTALLVTTLPPRDASDMNGDKDALRATDAKLRAAFNSAKKSGAKLPPLMGMLHMAVLLGAADDELSALLELYMRLSGGYSGGSFIHGGVPLVYLAIDKAVLHQDYRVLELMREAGALDGLARRYNVFSKIATSYGDEGVEVATWLHAKTRHGVSIVSAAELDDYTPLMLAAKKGSKGLVHAILALGDWTKCRSVNDTNRMGESALSLADENGHEECVRLIEAHLFEQYTAYERVNYDRAVIKMEEAKDMAKARIAAAKADAKDFKRKRQEKAAAKDLKRKRREEPEAEAAEAAVAEKPKSSDEAVPAA